MAITHVERFSEDDLRQAVLRAPNMDGTKQPWIDADVTMTYVNPLDSFLSTFYITRGTLETSLEIHAELFDADVDPFNLEGFVRFQRTADDSEPGRTYAFSPVVEVEIPLDPMENDGRIQRVFAVGDGSNRDVIQELMARQFPGFVARRIQVSKEAADVADLGEDLVKQGFRLPFYALANTRDKRLLFDDVPNDPADKKAYIDGYRARYVDLSEFATTGMRDGTRDPAKGKEQGVPLEQILDEPKFRDLVDRLIDAASRFRERDREMQADSLVQEVTGDTSVTTGIPATLT